MNVLLLRPRPHQDTIGLQSLMICEPLELEYLAAAVKDKHEVNLVDMILEKKSLAYFINKYHPRVVAITGYIAHVNVIKDYATIIKEINPDIKIIVGGVHAEVVPEDFYHENIDYIITGNGIQSFVTLLEKIEQSDVKSTEKTGDTKCFKVSHGTEIIPDIFPNRSITSKYRNRYYYIFHNPCALIKTSYGCPFTCTFCFCRQVTGGKYFERDLEHVIEEIKQISEPEIYIVDDNFLVSQKRVERFCELLELHGISKRFLIYGRADFIAQHEETIKKFARVGLRAVIVGLESVDSTELNKYDKKSSVEINEAAVQVLKKYGVDCYATLILGMDWNKHNFEMLYNWLKKLDLRFINLQPFTPLPGTPLFEQYQESLIISREQYEAWDLAHLVIKPSNISIRSYYFQILKIYFRTTLSLSGVIKNLKYGLIPNLKLSWGVSKITWQYIKKIIQG